LNWLNFDLRKAFTVALLFLLPLISINNQQSTRQYGWYDRPFSFLAGVVEHSFFAFSEGIRGTTRQYMDLIDIKKENKLLHAQTEELRARLQQMDEVTHETNRLRKLLEFREQTKMELVAARIMSRDLLSEHSTIRIDKGTAQGLKAGMAVISTEGVVGHIFRPEAYTAHVLLINDRYSVVDGVVGRSRARGLVEGRSQNTLALQYVEKSEDIKKGDVIVTSGLDNVFPKGFPVAVVENVENKPYAVALKVELKPVVDSDKIEEVFIIVGANNQDLSERMNK
jgi:rod shape-determining protein MreC